ncbi:MAG: hypothetical protein ACK502_00500 [Alphaproteobacteria bacterium]
MTELSTLGRAALYDHMVEALASHGTGKLNKKSLLNSADVTDDDLRLMINLVCDVGDYKRPDTEKQLRDRLVDTLADLLEHVSCMPGLVTTNVQPILRGSNPDSNDDPSLLQFQSERTHAIAQGPASMTPSVLHVARVAAGWKSYTVVGAGSTAGKKVLSQMMESYLQKQVASGLSEEEASKQMEREYIAVHETFAVRPSAARIARNKDTKLTQRHIDLSPQAIEDFNHAMQRRQEEKSQGSDVYNLFKRYGMPYNQTLARQIIRELWEKEVGRLVEAGFQRAVAESLANKEYVDCNAQITQMKLGQNLSPRAYNDIETSLIHAFLDREKAGRS